MAPGAASRVSPRPLPDWGQGEASGYSSPLLARHRYRPDPLPPLLAPCGFPASTPPTSNAPLNIPACSIRTRRDLELPEAPESTCVLPGGLPRQCRLSTICRATVIETGCTSRQWSAALGAESTPGLWMEPALAVTLAELVIDQSIRARISPRYVGTAFVYWGWRQVWPRAFAVVSLSHCHRASGPSSVSLCSYKNAMS